MNQQQKDIFHTLKKGHEIESSWSFLSLEQKKEKLEDLSQSSPIPLPINARSKEKNYFQLISSLAKLEKTLGVTRPDHAVATDVDRDQSLVCHPFIFVAHHLRSAYNVGQLFRTAECLGAREVILTGHTPTPEHKKVQTTARQTHEFISWTHQYDIRTVINRLHAMNYQVVACEISKSSIDYSDYSFSPYTALVLGHEKEGLPTTVLDLCDAIVAVPCYGKKNSLNVAVAASIIASRAILPS